MSACIEGAARDRFSILLIAASLSPPEKAACISCANAWYLNAPFILADEIDLIFSFYAPSWRDKRRDAWAHNFALFRETITVDGQEISVYLLLALWVVDLSAKLQGALSIPDDCTVIKRYP